MARRRKGAPIHGWIVLDKPKGVTSTAAVAAVKRMTGAAKAGHAGALDPLATGVLPIALGEASKLVPYLMDARKRYRFTAQWGFETASCDLEGEPIRESDLRPSPENIRAALPQFLGRIEQTPPIYSAVKVDGVRAYDLARSGETVTLEPRPVVAHELTLMEARSEDADFDLLCGKGFYVRSLARDLGRALGTAGCVTALRRTQVGAFHIKDAVPLDELERIDDKARVADFIRPLPTALDDIPALAVDGETAMRLRRGQSAALSPLLAETLTQSFAEPTQGSVRDDFVFVSEGDAPVAMATWEPAGAVAVLRPIRVFVI